MSSYGSLKFDISSKACSACWYTRYFKEVLDENGHPSRPVPDWLSEDQRKSVFGQNNRYVVKWVKDRGWAYANVDDVGHWVCLNRCCVCSCPYEFERWIESNSEGQRNEGD